jgi:hypothetical protein
MAAQRAWRLRERLYATLNTSPSFTHNTLARHFCPLARRSSGDSGDPVSFSRMNWSCSLCGAEQWLGERTAGSSTSPLFSRCCHRGCVVLDLLPDPPPDELRSLFTGDNDLAQDFRLHIRKYNCASAFTSSTASLQKPYHTRWWPLDLENTPYKAGTHFSILA